MLILAACDTTTENKNKTATPVDTVSAFTLLIPNKWTTEHIAFPIPFSPSIHYTGTENLRFAPGFESTSSNEHWSYAFLWWLNGDQSVNADTLSVHLTAYYRGLVSENIKNLTAEQKNAIVVVIKPDTAADKFIGLVKMIDYTDVMKANITLNVKAVIRKCNDHTAVLVRLSPQDYDHPVWKQLDAIDNSFTCAER